MGRMSRHVFRVFLLALISFLIVLFGHSPVHSQSNEKCFPESGHCVSGRILEFWAKNGGASTFGYPRGPQQEEFVDGELIEVQWFDRSGIVKLTRHFQHDRIAISISSLYSQYYCQQYQ